MLALAVAGPLLRPGLVLAVDLSQVPHPRLPPDYWGLAQGTQAGLLSRLPLDALFVLLGKVGLVAVGQKALLLAIVFLAGLGMHRLAPARGSAGRYAAGLLYAVNPFVYDRLWTGQWYLLLGYALLPHALRAFVALLAEGRARLWRTVLLGMAVGVAGAHMFALLLGLAVAIAVASGAAAAVRGRAGAALVLGRAAAGLGLTCVGCLYWLLPTPGLSEFWSRVGGDQLALYETLGDRRWGIGLNVAGLYGFWNDELPIKAHQPAWPLLACMLLALSLLGLWRLRREPVAWAVAVAAVAGFLLALGIASPLTSGAYTWLLQHVTPLRSFREPQKAVALLAFAYAYLLPAGGEALAGIAPGPRARRCLAVGLVALPLAYGYRTLGGLWDGLHTTSYPQSWSEARAVLRSEAAGSRTLVLPWSGYIVFRFTHWRTVANPAPAFFDTPVLASRSIGAGDAAQSNADPEEAVVAGLLHGATPGGRLGRCLAALGVSHILLPTDADDAGAYRVLDRQRDIVVERRWRDLILYRNEVPSGLVLAAPATPDGGPCASSGGLRPLPWTRTSPVAYRLGEAPRPGERTVLALSHDPGWKLDGVAATPFAEAVNAFPGRPGALELSYAPWHAYRRNYGLGMLALAALALLRPLLALAERRRRRR